MLIQKLKLKIFLNFLSRQNINYNCFGTEMSSWILMLSIHTLLIALAFTLHQRGMIPPAVIGVREDGWVNLLEMYLINISKRPSYATATPLNN